MMARGFGWQKRLALSRLAKPSIHLFLAQIRLLPLTPEADCIVLAAVWGSLTFESVDA